MVYTPMGRWSQKHIATILGLTEQSWSKLLNGQIYPARLQTMQKIEIVFGWPVREQVDLIPVYWEWPEQAGGTTGRSVEETSADLRYAMKLAKVVSEWTAANPRTVAAKDLKLHPALKPINRDEGRRFTKREEPAPEPEKQEEGPALRPGVWGNSRPGLKKNPLVKR